MAVEVKVESINVKIENGIASLWLIELDKGEKLVVFETAAHVVYKAWVVKDWSAIATLVRDRMLMRLKSELKRCREDLERAEEALRELEEIVKSGDVKGLIERKEAVLRAAERDQYAERVRTLEEWIRRLEGATEAVIEGSWGRIKVPLAPL